MDVTDFSSDPTISGGTNYQLMVVGSNADLSKGDSINQANASLTLDNFTAVADDTVSLNGALRPDGFGVLNGYANGYLAVVSGGQVLNLLYEYQRPS